MRVLIIGGYGTFGGRLVDLLLDEERLTLLVAGRRPEAAEAFCAKRQGAATLVPLAFDRGNASAAALKALAPDIVVDATGPFQIYGDDPYRIVRTCIEAGAHWLDLADGAAFVTGISVLDELARTKGRFVLSGVSSFPVLSAAVVRRLSEGMDSIESIHAGIAPSPFAGVGLNVITAIASYAGKPIAVVKDGAKTTLPGLISSRRMLVNVPGRVPLDPIRFGLVDVPDLQVLPREWPEAKTVWVGAGPKPAALHRLLWLAAWLVRLRLLPSLVPFARIMDWVVNHVRWGEHRGGMIVEVSGRSGGAVVQKSWHLLAEGDHGPLIPSMAVEAIIRKCLDVHVPEPGARPAHHALELADYDAMFAKRHIVTGFRQAGTGETPYAEVLGSAFADLPEPVQRVHSFAGSTRLSGRGYVTGPGSFAAKLIARVFGFPPTGVDVPVVVDLSRKDGVELWQRSFAGKSFRSTQRVGRGRYDGLIVERFGPTGFGMAVVVEQGALSLVLRRWDVLGIPMPKFLLPRVIAGEHGADGRFNFSVEISLPLIGRLVRYQGWLVEDAHDKSSA